MVFGQQGQYFVSGGVMASFGRTTLELDGVSFKQTDLRLSPSLAYFFSDRLFVAGQLRLESQVSTSSNTERSATRMAFGFGGGAGVDTPLGSQSSLMVSLMLLRLQDVADSRVPGGKDAWKRTLATFTGHLTFHPMAHFFVGFGPSYTLSLASDFEGETGPSVSAFSFECVIALWW